MNELWQNVVVLAMVAAAGSYLLLRVWKTVVRKKVSACGGGGCNGCASNSSQSQPKYLMSIEPFPGSGLDRGDGRGSRAD